VLLLDEPLSALDRKLREETRFELTALQKRIGLTFVVVTHDQEEAMSLADRIGVMNAGKLAQVGPPAEIYEQPSSRWVAGFIGDVNLIEGRVVSSGLGHTVIEGAAGERVLAVQARDMTQGAPVWVALRPEKVQIDTVASGSGENSLAGRVVDIAYLGGVSVYRVRLDNGRDMQAAVTNSTRQAARPIGSGDRVWLSFAPEAAVVLPS
jgi:putrescine transport system ATP-binding protein